MSEYPLNTSPEKVQVLDDNARKFVIENLDANFATQFNTTSYVMTTDWLVTDEDSETKLAHKSFDDGEQQILIISKRTENGRRTSRKEKITQEEYEKLLASSVLRVTKRRYEFEYTHADVTYDIKLDEFADSRLIVLEVDASTDDDRLAFDPTVFPAELNEVTGTIDYYGYRVASVV